MPVITTVETPLDAYQQSGGYNEDAQYPAFETVRLTLKICAKIIQLGIESWDRPRLICSCLFMDQRDFESHDFALGWWNRGLKDGSCRSVELGRK